MSASKEIFYMKIYSDLLGASIIHIIAKFKGDEFCQSRRNRFIFICAGAAVSGEDIEIVFGNAQSLSKFPFGYILFSNDFI